MENHQQQRVLIDSRDRISGSIQEAIYNLDKPISVKYLRLDWIQIFNTFWNVTSMNNAFILDGVTHVIAPGFYTSASLCDAIDLILKGVVDASIGAVYSSSTGACTWTLGTHTFTPGSAQHLFGFVQPTTGTFQTLINTSNPLSINVLCSEFSGTDVMRFTNRSSLDKHPFFSLPIFAEHNGLNYYQPTIPGVSSCSSRSLERFTIELTDAQGQALMNLTDYQIHLTFF